MSRFLLVSALVGGFSLVHFLVFRRMVDSLLSDSGSFPVFLLSTTGLRLGVASAVLLVVLDGGISAALAAIAGLWCMRTVVLVFTLLQKAL
ncbi:MAG TPA: hypothetical protein VNN62_16855 [Methylomirabilota bacterium]|jgi:hypothetical protein|nr:hypothetical protein [Methylomirabilota bacterium]